MKSALKDLNSSIECDPRPASPYYLRHFVRYELGDYFIAFKMRPEFELYVDRATAYDELNRLDEEIKDLTSAISMRPKDHTVYLQRAHTYMRKG